MKSAIFLLAFIALAYSQSVTLKDSADLTADALAALRKDQLDTLNILRSLHGCSPLVINETLNKHAQDYAKKLFTDKPQILTPSNEWKNGEMGENLYWDFQYGDLSYSSGSVVSSWYGQKQNYNFTSGSPIDSSLPYQYFTAEIWKDVKSVGFGFYGGKDQYFGMDGTSIYIVANFYPVPNIEGKFLENVPVVISQS